MVDKKHIDNYVNQALKPTVSNPVKAVVSAAVRIADNPKYELHLNFDDELSPAWTEELKNITVEQAKKTLRELKVDSLVSYNFYEIKEIDLF